MARFTKGQVVYYASSRCSEKRANNECVKLGMVITRTVDACGNKQMTFENHGNDSVFGKKAYAAYPNYFATAEEAFQYLSECAVKIKATACCIPTRMETFKGKIFSDQNDEWYEFCKEWGKK